MLSLSRGGFLLWRFNINAAEARKKTEIRNFIGGIRCRASNMHFGTILSGGIHARRPVEPLCTP